MKVCSKCKLKKSEEDFYLRSDTGKRKAACNECESARKKINRAENLEEIAAHKKIYYAENREEIIAHKKIYYAENREEIIAKRKIYYAENREKVAAKDKSYRAENREEVAARQRVYKYGVTPDDFKRMLVEQGGVCAICGSLGGGKAFCIDHDHETGKVRGLLCGFCNKGIGHLKDSSDIARRATEYLKRYGK